MTRLIKDYWSGLEARERRLIQLGGPVILLLVGYLLVWQPIQERREASSVGVQQEENLVAFLQGLSGQLQPIESMTERQWQALAQSQGLRQVEVTEDAGRWLISAQAREPRQVERFLQAAGQQGWHWEAIDLQGRPLQLQLELRPL